MKSSVRAEQDTMVGDECLLGKLEPFRLGFHGLCCIWNLQFQRSHGRRLAAFGIAVCTFCVWSHVC